MIFPRTLNKWENQNAYLSPSNLKKKPISSLNHIALMKIYFLNIQHIMLQLSTQDTVLLKFSIHDSLICENNHNFQSQDFQVASVAYVNKPSLVNNYFSNVLEKIDFSPVHMNCELL